MGFINKYPYVDFHELNADALIAKVDDASAEAKASADTVATYNDRLTTVENDLAPIKSAMPGLASDVSDLQHDVGIMDSLITNTINPGLDTLQNEVETPSTGLLDRMTAAESSIGTLENEVETPTTGLLDRVTALENAPAVGGVTEYLRFGTGGTPIDWDPRITYTYLDDLIATTASADKTVNIILVEDDEVGTTWYYTLNEGRYQVSAGTPRGGFAFTCRKPVLDANNAVIGYNVCTVDVDKNNATPTYNEVYEDNLYIYNTNEKVVGIWTDNKPVYEKIITTPMPSTPNTSFLFAHDIADIDNIIEYKAFMIFPNGTVHTFNDIQLDNGGIYSPAVSFLGVDKTNITIMCGMDRSTSSGRVFLRYTKTTD